MSAQTAAEKKVALYNEVVELIKTIDEHEFVTVEGAAHADFGFPVKVINRPRYLGVCDSTELAKFKTELAAIVKALEAVDKVVLAYRTHAAEVAEAGEGSSIVVDVASDKDAEPGDVENTNEPEPEPTD